MLTIALVLFGFSPDDANAQSILNTTNEVVVEGRQNNRSWFAPTMTLIPGNADRLPLVFATAINLVGRDLGDQHVLKTDNFGKSWSNAILPQNWHKIPLNLSLRSDVSADYNVFETPYFRLHYHKMTDSLIAIGRTHFTWDEYKYYSEPFKRTKDERFFDGLCEGQLEGSLAYSLWSPEKETFDPWDKLYLPVNVSLQIFPFGQFHEEDDGTLLIPAIDTSGQAPPLSHTEERYLPLIARFGFDGTNLYYIEHGDSLSVTVGGKWSNTSLVKFDGKYIVTIQQKDGAVVASSDDGLHYTECKPWCFDDGNILASYDTSQKLLKHGSRLYLVYTRKSSLNGWVHLDQAPLWIAEIDSDNLTLIKATEQIVIPEKLAAMSDFDVVSVSGYESWVITGERIQGDYENRYIGDLLLGRVTFTSDHNMPSTESNLVTANLSNRNADSFTGIRKLESSTDYTANTQDDLEIETEILLHGRRDNRNWFSPEAEILPAKGDKPPQVFVAVQLVTGHDMGNPYLIRTDDLGNSWSGPMIPQNWHKEPVENNEFKTPIFGLQYHEQTDTLIAHGRTHIHRDRNDHPDYKRESKFRPSFTEYHRWEFVYSLWNPEQELFEPWNPVELPADVSAHFTVFHQGQWLEDDDGTLLVPGFWALDVDQTHRPVVLRFGFDGTNLVFMEHGPYLSAENAVRQGWSNCSLVRFNGKYLLFVRLDQNSSVASSDDGLHFNEIKAFYWDNGEPVYMNNNSSKWLLLNGKLYITYTRVSELSGSVLGMRAPLWIAEVDPDALTLIKATERIVFPQKSARMDNHTTVSISDKEAWVISGETIRWGRDGLILRKVGDLLLARIKSE